MERSRGCRFIRTPAYFVNLRARHSTSDMLLLHSGKRLQQACSNDEPIITGWKRPGRFAACIILIVSNNTTTNEFSVRLNEISRHVDCYVADLRTNGRGVLPWIPQKYRITSWALISSGYGYNVPHVIGWDGLPASSTSLDRTRLAPTAIHQLRHCVLLKGHEFPSLPPMKHDNVVAKFLKSLDL
jgi:hypothetical protein